MRPARDCRLKLRPSNSSTQSMSSLLCSKLPRNWCSELLPPPLPKPSATCAILQRHLPYIRLVVDIVG